jgi:hypothetical protein
MTNSYEIPVNFRIYTQNGFVFDIPIKYVYEHRNRFLYNKEMPYTSKIPRVDLLGLIDYVKKLNWCDIVDNLEFVGIIESPHLDLLSSSQIDIVESGLNYKPLLKQKLKLKIIQ